MPSPIITVFYANLLYEQWDWPLFHRGRLEIPDGAYMLVPPGIRIAVAEPGWYRKDMTPVLIEDVPKETRLAALLLGLS